MKKSTIFYVLTASIGPMIIVSIPFSSLDDYIVLLWLLLWSVVGTLLGYLKYKKTLKKGKNTPIMP